MAGYGWEEYDVRTGGKQVIRDQGNHIDITTEFVKVEGGENGMGFWPRLYGTGLTEVQEVIGVFASRERRGRMVNHLARRPVFQELR